MPNAMLSEIGAPPLQGEGGLASLSPEQEPAGPAEPPTLLSPRYLAQLDARAEAAPATPARRTKTLPTPRALSEGYLLRLRASLLGEMPEGLRLAYLRRIGGF